MKKQEILEEQELDFDISSRIRDLSELENGLLM